MGADGGTIPKRSELVKTKQKQEQIDKNAFTVDRWFLCGISRQQLRKPIVACQLGRLYNKDAVFSALLEDRSILPKHISAVRDVVTLTLTDNTSKNTERMDSQATKKAQFMCPVTMKEMNGQLRFVFLWTCGCVYSEMALKELSGSVCLTCGTKYDVKQDVVVLNSTKEEELKEYADRIEARKLLASKKNKRKHAEQKSGDDTDLPSKNKSAKHEQVVDGFKEEEQSDIMKIARKITQESNDAPRILSAKQHSTAIQSLYQTEEEKNAPGKGTWLTKGTFTRYVN